MFGAELSNADLYTKLYEKSLEGDSDCGGVLVCNYMAGILAKENVGIASLTGRSVLLKTPIVGQRFMAFHTEKLNNNVNVMQQGLLDKHYLRKHGKNAHYGQDK